MPGDAAARHLRDRVVLDTRRSLYGVRRELQRSLLHQTGAGTADISILVRSLVEAVRGARTDHPAIGREVLDTLTAELARQGIATA